MKTFWGITRNRYLFLADVLIVLLAYGLTVVIDHTVGLSLIFSENFLFIALTSVILAGYMYAFGCYQIYWIYAGTKDYCRLLLACFCFGVTACILGDFSLIKSYALRINVVSAGITSIGVLGLRMILRAVHKLTKISRCEGRLDNPKKVFIVGAGSLGIMLARDLSMNDELNYQVIGFIDDDSQKRHLLIGGAEVLGNTDDMKRLYEKLKPDEIIYAISTASAEDKKRVLSRCAELPCGLKTVSGFADSLHGGKSTDFIRKVDVEDLLGRESVKLDNDSIVQIIKGKTIMVTGGGGSIGSELCRQMIRFSPERLIILDIYENNAFDLENELREKAPECEIKIVIASVRDRKRLEQVFADERPEVVFHAAAHKHVPMMETNAMEAVKNNVFGTYNVACCAKEYGAEKFVLISTDKAVNPTNIMGATKRVCEMIVQAMQGDGATEFVAVRFGNVLNSNGSVLPIFKKQIERGGPITVTHPDITRFFMTIPEAAQLVLQAAAFAQGGEIFVLDMGEPVRIGDMAENLIRLSGLRPGKDIEIVYTGLRPGEKLYEELLMDEEGLEKTSHDKIHIGKPFFHSMEELQQKLNLLAKAVETENNEAVRKAIATVVPTYCPPKEEKLPDEAMSLKE